MGLYLTAIAFLKCHTQPSNVVSRQTKKKILSLLAADEIKAHLERQAQPPA